MCSQFLLLDSSIFSEVELVRASEAFCQLTLLYAFTVCKSKSFDKPSVPDGFGNRERILLVLVLMFRSITWTLQSYMANAWCIVIVFQMTDLSDSKSWHCSNAITINFIGANLVQTVDQMHCMNQCPASASSGSHSDHNCLVRNPSAMQGLHLRQLSIVGDDKSWCSRACRSFPPVHSEERKGLEYLSSVLLSW